MKFVLESVLVRITWDFIFAMNVTEVSGHWEIVSERIAILIGFLWMKVKLGQVMFLLISSALIVAEQNRYQSGLVHPAIYSRPLGNQSVVSSMTLLRIIFEVLCRPLKSFNYLVTTYYQSLFSPVNELRYPVLRSRRDSSSSSGLLVCYHAVCIL